LRTFLPTLAKALPSPVTFTGKVKMKIFFVQYVGSPRKGFVHQHHLIEHVKCFEKVFQKSAIFFYWHFFLTGELYSAKKKFGKSE
jgi:hypothetical protein